MLLIFFNAADLEHMVLMTLLAVGHYTIVNNSVHKGYLIGLGCKFVIIKTISSRSAVRFF